MKLSNYRKTLDVATHPLIIPLIETIPYLSHTRSRNFASHLLWFSTTKGKSIVKLLAIIQTVNSNYFGQIFKFLKIAWLRGKIKRLRFISLSFFLYSLPVQLILEISATYRLLSYLLADNCLICRLRAQCMISNTSINFVFLAA